MKTPKIVTSNPYPPIPIRQFDWCAHYDGEEEAQNYGWGKTEALAVFDFLENCKASHDERLGITEPLSKRLRHMKHVASLDMPISDLLALTDEEYQAEVDAANEKMLQLAREHRVGRQIPFNVYHGRVGGQ